MSTTIKTRLQLRRDTEANYNVIKDTFVPLKGEVLLVDTAKDGLRSKVGDGTSTFAQLSYSDQVLRDLVSGIVVQGYYYNNNFYTNIEHTIKIVAYDYKIYIDIPTLDIYGYFSEDTQYLKLVSIPTATSSTAGVMKLYPETGSNTDGTMTQKSITDELGKKFVVTVGTDQDIVFTNGVSLL